MTNFQKKCHRYLEMYFDSEISLQKFSYDLGYSKWKFLRKFKRDFGTSPSHFLWSLRLNYSHIRMISDKSATPKKVCYESGFTSLSHFSKKYKSHFGHPPSSRGIYNTEEILHKNQDMKIFDRAFYYTIEKISRNFYEKRSVK